MSLAALAQVLNFNSHARVGRDPADLLRLSR